MKLENDNGIRASLNLKELEFEEEKHTYKYKGKKFTSATTLLKKYFPFNGPKVAEYLIAAGFPNYRNRKVPEILKTWSEKAGFGTAVHKFCEDYLNGEFVEITNQHERVAFNYIQKQEFEDAVTEVKICHPEWGISGMVDALVRKNGKWYIYDWKTDSKIRDKGFVMHQIVDGKIDRKQVTDNGKAKDILAEFENCNLVKYSFQLGIYKLILESFYDIPIHGMVAVHFDDVRATEYVIPFHCEYIGMIVKNYLNNTS